MLSTSISSQDRRAVPLLAAVFLIMFFSRAFSGVRLSGPASVITQQEGKQAEIVKETEEAKKEKKGEKSRNYNKPSYTIVPLAYYNPETRIAFGAGGTVNYRLGNNKEKARPSSLSIIGIYTQNKQYQISIKPEIYLNDNSLVLSAYLKNERFPQNFYGTGNGVAISVEGETYTPQITVIQFGLKKRFWKSMYAGFQYEAKFTDIRSIQAGGLLDSSRIEGVNGGLTSGLGLSLAWDNRDSIYFPRHGKHFLVTADAYSSWLGSDYLYRSVKFDLRSYYPFPEGQVLAVQLYMRLTSGTPPFYELSSLGGDTVLRGYYRGLYRDKDAIALQAEYRVPVVGRFGVVGFAAMGKVGGSFSDLKPTDLRFSIGTGLRYKFDKQEGSNLRMDFAWGNGAFGMYITAQEAF